MSMAATYGAAILILDSSEMSFDNLDILARFARREREKRWGAGIESLDGMKKKLKCNFMTIFKLRDGALSGNYSSLAPMIVKSGFPQRSGTSTEWVKIYIHELLPLRLSHQTTRS